MRAVLGLKLDPWHDTGAAVVLDGRAGPVVVAISQERLDRQKHSRAFPRAAIEYCLATAGLRLQDLSLVVADFIAHPSVDDRWDGLPDPDRKRAFFRHLEELRIPVVFAEHHLCHAASAYFATDWEEAAALVIDGHGSCHETQTLFRCHGAGITKVTTSHRPGVGWMMSATTERLLGFGHLQEGKSMGLAGWAGSGVYTPDPAFRGQAFSGNAFAVAYEQFRDRQPEWHLHAPPHLLARQPEEDPLTPPFPAYAAAAQCELQARVLAMVRASAGLVRVPRLCYAGGVALNILANRDVVEAGVFDEVFIQPAASDAGIPLGAALLGYYSYGAQPRPRWVMPDAFLGRDYDRGSIDAAVAAWAGPRYDQDVSTVARLIANDYLVGWVQGAAEYGPRALGHRSLLCLPRHVGMKAYLNREVKHREMFRPFAPIVPAEVQGCFFDLDRPSPYMLINARVRPEIADRIPAVVHADGTARVQAIERNRQPELHALLLAVGQATGLPILLNTSLNLAGEPIVETPGDAVELFTRARLDALVIGHRVLTKAPLASLLTTCNPGLTTEPSG